MHTLVWEQNKFRLSNLRLAVFRLSFQSERIDVGSGHEMVCETTGESICNFRAKALFSTW